MKWVLIPVGAVVALVAIAAGIGAMLPKGHTAARTARFSQSAEAVWVAITDYSGQTSWRTELERVEQLPDHQGHPVWREFPKSGSPMTLETLEALPPRRLVRRIADEDLPFGGTWMYEIEATAEGSTLTITEDGEVYNPFMRFVMKVFLDPGATAEGYLKALGKKFGEDVAVEKTVG